MTHEEKSTWERLKARKQESLNTIEGLEQLLQLSPDHPGKHFVVEEIERERIYETVATAMPE